MYLFFQAVPDPLASAPALLQWGALGVLVILLFLVFFYLIPSHNQTIRHVVKDNKETCASLAESLNRMADQHERTTDRICAEIKTCRMEGHRV